ncbi:hypothetical protein ECDEC1A_4072 [Escherichia coli DEC1A]|nr:hypothetical protein ECDEC1A_4072 [Escherichia coli DEC1A]ESD15408.1 hypothetical protein HMPREF1597_04500 [Escherichia coli 907701]ESD58347.1 hypothetical protein HMPREF1607_02480 [Escherichia coli 908524]ESE18383.1 hypothetical protein HMPREF1618_02967 [Escherichia coli 908691]
MIFNKEINQIKSLATIFFLLLLCDSFLHVLQKSMNRIKIQKKYRCSARIGG